MKFQILLAVCLWSVLNGSMAGAADAKLRIIKDANGTAVAALVDDAPLVYLTQLLPQGSGDVSAQLKSVIGYAAQLLDGAGSSLADVVRLHLYAPTPAAAAEALQEIGSLFPESKTPPVTIVQTALPDAAALVAIDVVARQAKSARAADSGDDAAHFHILPRGRRAFISGQAEKGDGSLASATTKTMESLEATLKFLGMAKKDAAQVKCFLTPMKEASVAREALIRFFAPLPLPPVAFVEWESSLPIEIEMVASDGGVANKSGPAGNQLSFITPPEMKASPVFCRVVQAAGGPLLFTGSLWGKEGSDPEGEVRDIFSQLNTILTDSGSDLRHLVKATYHVSGEDVSKKLNDIRPEFYDPARPPAASKAMVKGAGRAGRTFNMDMIAAPPAR